MRWLFVGIVALNILYLGWSLGFRDQVAGPVAEAGVAQAESAGFPARLQLLSERGVAVAQAESTPPVMPVAGCPAVGPLAPGADVQGLIKALAAKGFDASTSEVERTGQSVYWVFIPPLSNRQQALRKLREIQSKGIESFVVSSGTDMNAISLGSFSSRESAMGVEARLRASGYDVGIREQERVMRQMWLVLSNPMAQGVVDAIPRELRGDLRLDRVPCKSSR